MTPYKMKLHPIARHTIEKFHSIKVLLLEGMGLHNPSQRHSNLLKIGEICLSIMNSIVTTCFDSAVLALWCCVLIFWRQWCLLWFCPALRSQQLKESFI